MLVRRRDVLGSGDGFLPYRYASLLATSSSSSLQISGLVSRGCAIGYDVVLPPTYEYVQYSHRIGKECLQQQFDCGRDWLSRGRKQ
jgi:hypothetical protein